MIKNSIFITVFLLFAPVLLFSQKVTDSFNTIEVNTPVSISYLGDYLFSKPGVNLTIENTIRQTILTKKSSKIVTRSVYVPINLGWYYHKGYNSAIMLSSGIGCRTLRSTGLFYGSALNLGVMRTFINGPTYVVNGEDISTVTGGYFYGNIMASFETGWDLSKCRKSLPVSTFVKLNALIQFPYNSGILFHIMPEIGLRYAIPLKDKTKQYYKSKTQKI